MMFNSFPEFGTSAEQQEDNSELFGPSNVFLKNYLVAQKLTPVQEAEKNFGDLPIIGPLIRVIRDYEDRINYRDADPNLRKMLHLE